MVNAPEVGAVPSAPDKSSTIVELDTNPERLRGNRIEALLDAANHSAVSGALVQWRFLLGALLREAHEKAGSPAYAEAEQLTQDVNAAHNRYEAARLKSQTYRRQYLAYNPRLIAVVQDAGGDLHVSLIRLEVAIRGLLK